MISNRIKQVVFSFATQLSSCQIEDTIIVSGAPRSGTTWLAELLRELRGYKFLNEPLLLHNNGRAAKAGFHWRTYLHPDETAEEKETFLKSVLSGHVQHGPLWHYKSNTSVGKLAEYVTHQKLVVKFCRAGRLLHWLSRKFDVRGIVVIVRHPCAVIASQLSHGGWEPGKLVHNLDSDEALGEIPPDMRDQFEGILSSLGTRIDVMTAVWCLDYYIPFIEHASYGHPWTLVSYERLILEGKREIDLVLSSLGTEMNGSIRKQLVAASAYASEDLYTKNRRAQLAKWKTKLSPSQVSRILDIVAAFGIDFYSEDLEPTVPDKNERAGCAAVQIVTLLAISTDIQPAQRCHT